jgi:hypothetical protein
MKSTIAINKVAPGAMNRLLAPIELIDLLFGIQITSGRR